MCITTLIHMTPALFLQVSPASGVPIYRQLQDQIRSQIAGGGLAPGEFLPSVRQLAQRLAVNPLTISKAYSLLERDGLVELARGKGSQGNAPPPLAKRQQQRQGCLYTLQ